MLGSLFRVGKQFGLEGSIDVTGVAPRGRVPAIGRLYATPSRTRVINSGEEPSDRH